LSAYAYVGDGNVLLAFDLESALAKDLAGFSIARKREPDGEWIVVPNRLSFDQKLHNNSTQAEIDNAWTPSTAAPFQKFHWLDYPNAGSADPEAGSSPAIGTFTYSVTAVYFSGPAASLALRNGPAVTLQVTLGPRQGAFHVGFTKGYLSSQAYAREFKNAQIRPSGAYDYLYDAAPFAERYAWLGYHARQLVFDFLDAALADLKAGKNVTLDAFIYDIDEPDFVRRLAAFGSNLRVVLDDSKENGEPKADRAGAQKNLPRAKIVRTHFTTFAHDKVLIRRESGKAVAVICGSLNFSIRGFYAQANSIIRIDEPLVAAVYGAVFDGVFTTPGTAAFEKTKYSQKIFRFVKDTLPDFYVSFAPHKDGTFALNAVTNSMEGAKKNVIFAIMAVGTGPVIEALEELPKRTDIFSFGIAQRSDLATKLVASGQGGLYAHWQPLDRVVPEPFVREFTNEAGQGAGGAASSFTGITIHHKFVVVDFNTPDAVVYAGSSNLIQGGEQRNGDNLLAIKDREIATLYAIEGIRLTDHYAWRSKIAKATAAKPFHLAGPADGWYEKYYEQGSLHDRMRRALIP
jgi:hypothetical protein